MRTPKHTTYTLVERCAWFNYILDGTPTTNGALESDPHPDSDRRYGMPKLVAHEQTKHARFRKQGQCRIEVSEPKIPSSIERQSSSSRECEWCAKTTDQIRLELGITRLKSVCHICSEKEETYGLVPLKTNSQRSFRALELDKECEIPCIPRGRTRKRISIASPDVELLCIGRCRVRY